MDIHDGVYESVKYVFGTALSVIGSWFLWTHRKKSDRLDMLEKLGLTIENKQSVLDVELGNLRSDVAEIKEDLKTLIFKIIKDK